MTRPGSYVVTPSHGAPYRVALTPREGAWTAVVERRGETWSFELAAGPRDGAGMAGARPIRWRWDPAVERLWLGSEGHDLVVETEAAHRLAETGGPRAGGGGSHDARAPMPGLVVALLVESGAEVVAGQGVLVIEAMKMENEIGAPAAGVVAEISVRAGQAVEKGARLFRVEAGS